MKERPILFNGEMVRAILDGRKTMTRRVVKYDMIVDEKPYWCVGGFREGKLKCPYGVPGDRLWVREGGVTLDITVSHEMANPWMDWLFL